jgi:trimeric autotransporter adhesin
VEQQKTLPPGSTTTTTTTATPTTTTTTTTIALSPMIMTFNVASNGDTITLPYNSGGTYSGTINWGDGNVVTNSYANKSHVYTTAGNYDVTITGTATQFSFGTYGGTNLRLTDIKQWGNVGIVSYAGMFYNCTNLINITATDTPTFKPNTSISGMFDNASNFNQNLNSWNVSNVTNMNQVFYGATSFNGNISSWNTSNVTSMIQMFVDATSFNQNIGGWNVGNVANMSQMFSNADAFNQNIANWNVSQVANMDQMFDAANLFNQDLSSWCVTLIPTVPFNFSTGATAWVLPKPVWGTCPA